MSSLVERLLPFVRHTQSCSYQRFLKHNDQCRCGLEGLLEEVLRIEPRVEPPKVDLTDHASTSPGPVNCNVRQRIQQPTDAIPRSCARCGLGPCPFFNQDGSKK